MIRTQISLSPSDYQSAKQEAQSMGISLAELLRRALKTVLKKKSDRSWMKYAGMVQSGNTKSSQEIDDIVYGSKD